MLTAQKIQNDALSPFEFVIQNVHLDTRNPDELIVSVKASDAIHHGLLRAMLQKAVIHRYRDTEYAYGIKVVVHD